jgi:hypothetical protein
MHYKNGREAKEGDPVITLDYNRKVVVGVAYNLRPAEICNCDVAVLIPGGSQQLTCQTVGNLYHAEDCLLAIEPLALAPKG